MGLFKRKQSKTIVVDKGYEPSEVHFKQGKEAELTFKVKTDNTCLQKVVIKDLGLEKDLFNNPDKTIQIPTDKRGEILFACGMDMFHGKIVID